MVEVVPERQTIRISAFKYLLYLALLVLLSLLACWYYLFKILPTRKEFSYKNPTVNLMAKIASDPAIILNQNPNLSTSSSSVKIIQTGDGKNAAVNMISAIRIHRIIQTITDKSKYYILFSAIDDRCNVIKNIDKSYLEILVKDDPKKKYSKADIISVNPIINYNYWQDRAIFACVLDWSGSMSDDDIEAQKRHFGVLFDQIKINFKAAVIKFSTTVEYLLDLSSNIDKIKYAINKDIYRNATALYDAIHLGINPIKNAPYFRFQIITTDGVDNYSSHNIDYVTKLAFKNEISLLILGFGYASISDLFQLSERTEGYFIYVEDSKYLNEWFYKLADIINYLQVAEIKLPPDVNQDLFGVSITYSTNYFSIQRTREKK